MIQPIVPKITDSPKSPRAKSACSVSERRASNDDGKSSDAEIIEDKEREKIDQDVTDEKAEKANKQAKDIPQVEVVKVRVS